MVFQKLLIMLILKICFLKKVLDLFYKIKTALTCWDNWEIVAYLEEKLRTHSYLEEQKQMRFIYIPDYGTLYMNE